MNNVGTKKGGDRLPAGEADMVSDDDAKGGVWMETRPTREELRAQLQEKRWTISNAAAYLGVSRQRLYSAFADADRSRFWECAVRGMPECTRVMANRLQEERRKAAKKRPSRATVETPGHQVGAIVAAIADIGSIAEEGEEGLVAGIRGEGVAQAYFIRLPGGEDWFPASTFHTLFADTGKTDPRSRR